MWAVSGAASGICYAPGLKLEHAALQISELNKAAKNSGDPRL